MQSDIPTLLAAVERHEGIQVVSNSHPGVANQVFAQLNPQDTIEALYTKASDAVLRAEVDTAVTRIFASQAYRSAQAQFDTTDIPIVLNSAGCSFDFVPPPFDN
jgi:predicted secreted Zn-dependent protease